MDHILDVYKMRLRVIHVAYRKAGKRLEETPKGNKLQAWLHFTISFYEY